MGDLSKDFDRSEFACKCGKCGGFPVEPHHELVARLQGLRDLLGRKVIISSGIRCPEHNAAEGGVTGSAHTTGHEVDVVAVTSRDRYWVLRSAVLAGFRRIGINFRRGFVHLGTAPGLDQDVLWGYE